MIYYPLWTLMLAEIRDILIIVNACDLALFKALLGDGSSVGLKLEFIVQDRPLGIAHALILAEDFLKGSSVALVLGDNIFHGPYLEEILLDAKRNHRGATIFTYSCTKPERYGVVDFNEDRTIHKIIEKPKIAPSNQVVTGLYFYDQSAVSLAKTLQPSKRGELEITDLNNLYLDQGALNHIEFGKDFAWMDSGTFESLLEASNYIQLMQKMHNCKIGSIENCALDKGYLIDSNDFFESDSLNKTLHTI